MDGVSTIHEGWKFSASAYWRRPSFYVGLSYGFTQNANWNRIEVPGFCNAESFSYKSEAYRISISAGYYFHLGKARYFKKQKQLSNQATETGF